jgi:SsrA-binding protein
MAKKKHDENIIAVNKKASFKYHLLDRFEAGLVLTGSEVKSLRGKKANLSDSYVLIRRGEAWLINAHISPYPFAHQFNHNPKRDRKLLLHKKEIRKLTGKLSEKGLTFVPIKMYFKDGRAKIELALATGKKLFDKREDIKRRESERTIARVMKHK